MGKRGPKRTIEINWKQFEKLCGVHASKQEIAGWFDCSIDTILRRCKEHYGMDFEEVFKRKSGRGNVVLRRKIRQHALGGSVPLLIYLDKKYLGGLPEGVDGAHSPLPSVNPAIKQISTIDLVRALLQRPQAEQVEVHEVGDDDDVESV